MRPNRRFEADDAVVRGGAQYRADGLRAECPRDHTRRDRDAGAGAGAAGRVLGVPGVEAWRRIAVGELGSVQLAEQHCARVAREGYRRSVGVGHALGPYLRACRCADARSVEDVLRTVWDARERAAGIGGCGVGGAGLCERLLRQERRPCLQSRLQRLDAREQRFGELDGGEPPRRNLGGGLREGQFVRFSHGSPFDGWDWRQQTARVFNGEPHHVAIAVEVDDDVFGNFLCLSGRAGREVN